MKTAILVTGGLLLAGAVYLGASAAKAAKTGANLGVALFPKITKLGIQGMQVSVDAEITNDEKGSLTLSDPEVGLYHEGKLVSGTKFDGRRITIAPQSTLRLSDPSQLGSPVVLQIPIGKIVEHIPNAVAAITGLDEPFALEVRTTATVSAPGVPAFRYTVKETLTIQSPI